MELITSRAPIISVASLDSYILEIEFENGSVLDVDFARHIRTIKFTKLQEKDVFASAVSDGWNVKFQDATKISYQELIQLAIAPSIRASH